MAIRELQGATTMPVMLDTPGTRESAVANAAFVGRRDELDRLTKALDAARDGRGGVVLVGGESGLGKTRLVDEARIRAMIDGFRVATGMAVDGGGAPLDAWMAPLRLVALHGRADTRAMEVLATVDPDLWDDDEGDDDEIDAPGDPDTELGGASDVFMAVDRLLATVDAPTLLVLEDLQWASSATLDLLRWLAPGLARRQLLVLGTFRLDEAPALPERVPDAEVIQLARLDEDAVCSFVRGLTGRMCMPDVLAGLMAQTDGVPFFLVEVMRDLLQSEGGIDVLTSGGTLEPVSTEGMRRLMRRRIRSLPEAAVRALETAAVAGRRVDPDLIRALHPDLDVALWLASCQDAMVLAVKAGVWSFDHDKLRELLEEDLAPETAAMLHRSIASRIEDHAQVNRQVAVRLAHHWRAAGDTERECHWSERAGMYALEAGASAEAFSLLTRARALVGEPGSVDPAPSTALVPSGATRPDAAALRVVRLERGLCVASYRLGNLAVAQHHATRALAALGFRIPRSTAGLAMGALAGLFRRALQLAFRVRASDDPLERAVFEEATTAHTVLTEAHFYAHEALGVVWSSVRNVEFALPHGPSPRLAEADMLLGLMLGLSPVGDLGAPLRARAMALAERLGSPRMVAKLRSRLGVHHLGLCAWDAATEQVGLAQQIATEEGDRRLIEETTTQQHLQLLFQGAYDLSAEKARDGLELARQSGNAQAQGWCLLGLGDVATRRGHLKDAASWYQEAEPLMVPGYSRTESVWLYGMWSLVTLELGDEDRALDLARRALEVTDGRLPVGYWTQQGVAALAETFLRLSVRYRGTLEGDLNRSRRALWLFSRVYHHGRPAYELFEALRDARNGRPGPAARRLERVVTVADRCGMPYEAAVALRELALLDSARTDAQGAAADRFSALGCAPVRQDGFIRTLLPAPI